MAATARPTIAHGIARLHPDQGLPSGFRWGPDWSLPPNRSGRWVFDSIYDKAIRAELDEAVPLFDWPGPVRDRLDEARDALSGEEERRRAEWLGWADKREAEAFVREFTVRRRRERGDLPKIAAGTYIREALRTTTVWHIATGELDEDYTGRSDRLMVRTRCWGADLYVDLGDPSRPGIAERMDEPERVCKRCSRVAEREATEAVGVLA